MSAAKRALETGKAHYILIWIPEESENTLKNLLEKVC
jgi:cell division inhibitor SulA